MSKRSHKRKFWVEYDRNIQVSGKILVWADDANAAVGYLKQRPLMGDRHWKDETLTNDDVIFRTHEALGA